MIITDYSHTIKNKEKYMENAINIRAALIILALFATIVYLPALRNGFVNWDDRYYVYGNPYIQTMGSGFIHWAFTTEVAALWHPFTLISLAIDYSIWELQPIGYHLTNILLHTINTLLVFILAIKLMNLGTTTELRTSKRSLIAGVATAILFAVHPLHVESVSWVSERKDVLCALFYLLSIIYYLRYISTTAPKRPYFYSVCLFFFIIAILSKPMAVSLPLILLIIDFYFHKINEVRATLQNRLLEKLPFFAFSLILSIITIKMHTEEATASIKDIGLMDRIVVAIWAYIFYLFKMVFPFGLSPLYLHPAKIDILTFEYMGTIAVFSFITFICFLYMKSYRILLSLWSYYLITLIPVIGIVQVGSQAAADRYTYLPSLSPFLLAGLGAAIGYERCTRKDCRFIITLFLLIISGIFISKTVKQISLWHDSISLWTYQLKLQPNTAFRVYNNRGEAYIELHRYQQAINEYNLAIKINSQDADVHYNRGIAYSKAGSHHEEAIKDFRSAIELKPQFSKAYNNLGNELRYTGRYEEAAMNFNKAIELDPQMGEAYYNLGLLYLKFGNTKHASTYLNKAHSLGIRQAKYLLNE